MDNQFFSPFNPTVVATILNMRANNRLPIMADPGEKLSVQDAAFCLYSMAAAKPGSVEADVEQLHNDILNDGMVPGWHKITQGKDDLAAKCVSILALILADELGPEQPMADLEELNIARGFVSTIHKGEKRGGFGRTCVKGEEFEKVTLSGRWIHDFMKYYMY